MDILREICFVCKSEIAIGNKYDCKNRFDMQELRCKTCVAKRIEKPCSRCGQVLLLSGYKKRKDSIDGTDGVCCSCKRKRQFEIRRQNGVNPMSRVDFDLLPRLERELGITAHLDPSKYYLSSLCPLLHDWNNTGFTLRVQYKGGSQECCDCKNARMEIYNRNDKKYKEWLNNPRISPTVAELVFRQESSFRNCNRHLFDEEYRKEYNQRKREEYAKRYKENPEKERLRSKIYKHSNPEKVARWGDTRRKRVSIQSDGTVTKEKVNELLNKAKSCLYCSCKLSARTATIDHIVPISLGGQHSEYNIVVCCRLCNNKKRSKPFYKWINELDDKHKANAEKLYRQRYGASSHQQVLPFVY